MYAARQAICTLDSISDDLIEEKLRAVAAESFADIELWPIRLKPKPDELVSSWLMRLAMAHGLKLHTFCSMAWPYKAVWNRDIDKSADDEIIQVLAQKTGASLEKAKDTTLSAYEGFLFEQYRRFGPTPWLLPVGVWHRVRKLYGQQFCPRCLAEDKEPYYRRRWRLAFMICCERHGTLLLDRCPRCSASINFHRNELGDFSRPVAVSLIHCYHCGVDFRQPVVRDSPDSVTPAEVTFTRQMLQAIRKGSFQLSHEVVTYSHLFFNGLRQLVRILALPDKRIIALRHDLSHDSGFDLRLSERKDETSFARNVEELETNARRRLLNAARLLLSDWPSRFVEFSTKHQVWSSLWLKHLEATNWRWGRGQRVAPFWFWTVINKELHRPRYQPSAQEIRSAVKHLKHIRGKCNKKMLAEIFGMAVAYKRAGNLR